MCKYTECTKNRQGIINCFKIPERDNHKYDNIEAAVCSALRLSFVDINFRTMERDKTNYPSNIDTSITEFLLDKLKEANFISFFTDYFSFKYEFIPRIDSLTEINFDKWHNEACKKFLGVLEHYYSNAAYGKAQKIVNMMFKHLYCMKFGGDNQVLDEDYFKHCHLTLDSFTLEWFYREVVDKWYNKLSPSERGIQIHKGKMVSWSYLDCCEINVNSKRKDRVKGYIENETNRFSTDIKYYHYSFIQDIIREYFEKNKEGITNSDTPFKSEFIIWPEIQLHITAEALFGQSIGQEEMLSEFIANQDLPESTDIKQAQREFKKIPLKSKIDMLKKKIDIILKYCNTSSN